MVNDVFEVGLILSFETHYKTHLAAPVIGWEKDVFVLTKAIYIQGQPAKLKSNDPCKVRFLKDGVAYGFESEVITVQFFPYPLMFIKFPERIECIQLRGNPRFKINLQAMLSAASGALITANALILDISEGGCGLKVPVQEGITLSPEADYMITFKFVDKEISTNCRIRKLDQKGKYAYLLGMEFTDITPQNKETLKVFLDFLKKNSVS